MSNLTFLSKLIERVVAKRTWEHMIANNLHELYQSAYKRFHSCETALIKVQNDILSALDDDKCVILVLLDLSAAFDTVDHKKLLHILAERIGMGGVVLEWFTSYLTERIQSVTIDGIESDIWNILFGVPQGSVLGPILFTIYTSPLGDILRRHNITYHFYADDTQLYLSFDIDSLHCTISKIEACLVDIKKWMAAHFLCLNDNKTELLVIGKKHLLKDLPDISLKIGNDKIAPSSIARNIGAVFDNTLSMSDHISAISRGAWFHLNQISKIRSYLDESSTKTLIHSFVSSRLDSFNSLLHGVPKYELAKLQRIQNAAARLITGLKKHDHVTPTLIHLHWLPIEARIDFKILVLVFKCLNGLAPKYLSDLITPRNTNRSLRNSGVISLVVPVRKNVTLGQRAFSYAGPFMWNILPDECKTAKTLYCFKRRLKTHLFKIAYDL